MQILEHEQHRCGARSLGEELERLLEHPELRPCVYAEMPSERTQRLDERLIRQLRADEIDRAADEHLQFRGAGACRELGREPGLADARLAGDEDGGASPRLRGRQGALELPQLASPTYERGGDASLHPLSIAPSRR